MKIYYINNNHLIANAINDFFQLSLTFVWNKQINCLWLLFVIMKFEVVGFNHDLIYASTNQIYPSALTFACEAHCDILPYF